MYHGLILQMLLELMLKRREKGRTEKALQICAGYFLMDWVLFWSTE